jgi:hypothetical protein
MTVTHIVLCTFAPDIPAAEIAGIAADLHALEQLVPGMGRVAFGHNISTEGLAGGHTHAFVIPFADATARDAYLVHPAHQRLGARLVAATLGGVQGLRVVDI